MGTFTAPHIGNLKLGNGSLYFTPIGGARRHMGNCSALEFSTSVKKLEHYKNYAGSRTKDKTFITEKTASIKMTLEEFTIHNMALALCGTATADTDGNVKIPFMEEAAITGILEFEDENEEGPQWHYYWPSVSFDPVSTIQLITDTKLSEIPLACDVLDDPTDGFGYATLQESTTDTAGN